MTHLNSIGPARGHIQRRFAVTQNVQGYWIARESRGLIQGVFVNQRDAIRFALFEAGGGSASVVAGGAASSQAHSAAA